MRPPLLHRIPPLRTMAMCVWRALQLRRTLHRSPAPPAPTPKEPSQRAKVLSLSLHSGVRNSLKGGWWWWCRSTHPQPGVRLR